MLIDHSFYSLHQTCVPIKWTALIDLNQFIFFAKLIELIQFLSQVGWLVTESIRFHKVADLVDWLWGTGTIESIELIRNIPKNVNEIKAFPKKVNASQKRSAKLNVFQKKASIYIELIDFIESFESFLWLDWVDSYVLSNMIELIGIFKLRRFVVIESIHFHILPRLNWLIWRVQVCPPQTFPCNATDELSITTSSLNRKFEKQAKVI